MARGPKPQLTDKHYLALRMYEEQTSDISQIANAVGWSKDHFYALRTGDVEKAGGTSRLFSEEWKKIEQKKEDQLKSLVRENSLSIQQLLKSVIEEFQKKKKLSPSEKRLLYLYNNSISNNKPSISVKSLSYSYTKGLTPEELIHEFKRLKNIAESSFDRRTIPETPAGGPGSVSEADE